MPTKTKTPVRDNPLASKANSLPPPMRSRAQRIAEGKKLRDRVPRESHAVWKTPPKRRDPVAILKESDVGRLPELVPLRYQRMLQSPFTFLRGSAGLMAFDLATTPNTGMRVQACGDCHLMNFGLFATPERNLIFDINDFDETLPAPWEWDIKRLAVSFVVASRNNQRSDKQARETAGECVRAYRMRMRELSEMTPLDVWYACLDSQTIVDMARNAKVKKMRQKLLTKAAKRTADFLFPKISDDVGGQRRLIDDPPLLYHISERGIEQIHHPAMRRAMAAYRLSLPDERRVLLDRYHLQDIAIKVVGIGSVGTRCFVGLFFSAENEPLLLQFKEACPSVLAPYAGKSQYQNQGQRVVVGQRLLQAASDLFLGWTYGLAGRHLYVRQLRDMKMSAPIEGASHTHMMGFAELRGQALAQAHARSGDAAMITGYLGNADAFDQAVGEFSMAYADQNDKDYAVLVAAVKAGKIKATVEERQ